MSGCRCGASWGGLVACHCAACHRTFSSVKPFDRHRIGHYSNRICVDPGTVTDKKGRPAMKFNTDRSCSYWSMANYDPGPFPEGLRKRKGR
jgi:hypothetical protein